MKKFIIILVIIISFISCSEKNNDDPIMIAKKIADRVIHDTSFELEDVQQKPVLDIQVIDFNRAFPNPQSDFGFAHSKIKIDKDEKLEFGISYSEPVQIFVNNSLVFESREKTKFEFHEVAYAIFNFNNTFTVDLKKGANDILVKTSLKNKPFVYLREITEAEVETKAKFIPIDSSKAGYANSWCYSTSEKLSGQNYFYLKPESVKELVIPKEAAFQRDSYAEWNYANGALMMVLSDLSDAADETKYREFVKKFCGFTVSNYDLFKEQYFAKHDFRGSDHRIFRKGMLDDAGAPVLPFIEMKLKEGGDKYDFLINEMIDYVMNGQSRLPDGTLCRPEPEKWTVWADDLFMVVPLLVRMGEETKNQRYYDEAVKQIINFNKYLFDKETGLYKHGWFSRTNEKSNVFWGRANGWVVWAESEALVHLPKEHKDYEQVKNIFVEHLKGLLKVQAPTGMWHQVLNDNSSWEEASCTSMFIIGLSRAIRNGWIDKSYSANVTKAWNSLKQKFEENGIVKDICCGTGIGNEIEFYKNRKRYDNDPRGLGAVITAAIEIEKLNVFTN